MSAGDRAILNKSGRPGTGTDVINLCTSSLPAGHTCNDDADPNFDVSPYLVGYLAKDPSAQYIRTGIGALSNLGRNTFPTKPINNWDLSVLKRISIRERYKFEIGAQLLNLFNHPQFTPGYQRRELCEHQLYDGVGSSKLSRSRNGPIQQCTCRTRGLPEQRANHADFGEVHVLSAGTEIWKDLP